MYNGNAILRIYKDYLSNKKVAQFLKKGIHSVL